MNPFSHPLVLVNPLAGRGRAAAVRHAVESYWRQQCVHADFTTLSSPGEVRLRASTAASTGHSSVVVLGGDGTVHEAVNGIAGTGLPLGILPAGGGNDLARALDMPPDALESAHALLAGRTRHIDLLRLTDSAGHACLYAGAGGAGIDAEAAQLANTRFRRLPGAARYVAAAVAAFHEARPLQVKLHADDGTARKFRAHLVAVANTPSYGGGIFIAPSARIDDGWMDIAIIAPLGWTQLLDGLLLALRTGDIRWPEIERMRARKVRLETDRPMLFHGDGEVLGETPVEIEVLPAALEVMAPR